LYQKKVPFYNGTVCYLFNDRFAIKKKKKDTHKQFFTFPRVSWDPRQGLGQSVRELPLQLSYTEVQSLYFEARR
jgi:hypothetical protein